MEVSYELEKEIKKKVFKKSFYQFFKWAFNILEPQTKLEDTFHIKYLCDLLQAEIERIIRREAKGKDLIINIPPRTSKSKIVSQAWIAWIWIVAPHLRMIAVSFDEKLTLTNAQYAKDIIKSAVYQELFGDIFQIRKDVDSKEKFANNKGGERLSVTIGGNITGFGGEILLADDIQNPKTAESEVERENVKRYWVEALYNRLTPLNLGIRVNMQQRLHFEDLSGYLLETFPESYTHICLPAELSEHVKPKELREYYKDGLLDPIRLDKVELGKLKRLGSRYYAGQYSQIPTPDEGGIIKGEWFDIVEPATLTRDTTNEPIHFFIDSAYTEKTENDPTAILVCYKKLQKIYILEVIEVWMEFPKLKKFLIEYANRFQHNQYSRMFIEEAASGLSIAQELRTISNMNIVGVKKPKDDKITRAHAITATLEGRKVSLVKGSYIDNFLNQLKAFPNGKHDDQVDTLIMAVNELLINDTPAILWVG